MSAHGPHTNDLTKHSPSQYVNSGLAQAVRDSVHIASRSHDDLAPAPDTPDPHRAPIAIPRPAGRPSGQPELPSDRLVSVQNPFDDDIIPSPPSASNDASLDTMADLPTSRTKLGRPVQPGVPSSTSSTNLLPPTSPAGIMKTRRSLSSDSYGLGAPGRQLTAGQLKALEDKRGGRHADVIDTLDPTGLGTARWHHPGPYDAAAPSRNKDIPDVKAPMRAFPEQAAPASVPQRPAEPAAAAAAVQLTTPPTPPAKGPDARRAPAPGRERPRHAAQRRTSGGLTGQYSTSVPSGGYFASAMNSEERLSDAEVAQRDRQRERDQKRRALKAAWGIDEPEPFEDFGGSPGESSIDLDNDAWSPTSYPTPLPKPARSPSGNFGGTTPPVLENIVSPSNEYLGGAGPRPGGVKRTKSLMQRIKTMREHSRSPNHTTSLYLPSDEATPEDGRPGFFSRNSARHLAQRQISTQAPLEEEEPVPGATGFAIVESAHSKERARRALEKEAAHRTSRYSDYRGEADRVETLTDDPTAKAAGPGARFPKRLPTPPVGPVLPDFEDLLPTYSRDKDQERERDGGMGRKPSMVKKLKDRMR